MTPTDLETLRGLLKLAEDTTQAPWSAMWSGRTDGDHVTGLGCEIHGPLMETGVFKPASRIIAKVQDHMSRRIWRGNAAFISASRNAIPALTALLAERDALREALIACVSYLKDDSGGYETYKATLEHAESILNPTLSEGEKHD